MREESMKKLCTFFFTCFLYIVLISNVSAEQSQIRILYMNDFHGFAEPYKPFGSDRLSGGVAYLAAKAAMLRHEKPSLLLAAGDMIQGNNWANLSQGKSVIDLMNTMNFDAMVVGNHEFDFGQETLKKRITEAHFPILGANVEGCDRLKPYIIKEISGITIAVIGVVTEDTPISTHPRNVAGLKFVPVREAVQKYVNEVRDKAAVVIVLSHTGYANDRILAEQVKGIDIIVGGHSHTKVLSPAVIGHTIVVQAWEHAKALGVLDLTLEDGKIMSFSGHLDEIEPEPGKEDSQVMSIVDEYRKDVDAVLHETIGEASIDLDGENVRTRETNFGDFVADRMREVSGADITIINGGSIRTSIKKGPVAVKNIYTALPFDNYIVAIKLAGNQILATLEHGVSAVEKGEGRFPQISGLTFTYSLSSPPGARVKEVLIAQKPIDPDREYVVATNDFLAAGGDGYKAFGEAVRSSGNFSVTGGLMKGDKLVYSDSGRWLRDVITGYIRERKVISPGVEGRISETNEGLHK
jgi:5'-nucleotidase / UDP-sugar diphosphatase